VAEVGGRQVTLLSWIAAAANHLKDREQWMGWNISQRRRRLSLVSNNARFLILPGPDCPNLASRVLDLYCEPLADAETLSCVGAPSVVEVTREVEILKGKRTKESVSYVCTINPDPGRREEFFERICRYWGTEGELHQRLVVSCGEDSIRVRNRNALLKLVLGIVRRAALGIYLHWRKRFKNKRQSTVKDCHDAMNRFKNRLAFATIAAP